MGVKQKRQASAAFLGVLPVSENVVGGCCIPTTILAVSCPVGDIWNRQNRGSAARLPEQRPNQQPPRNPRCDSTRAGLKKKAAAVDAAAFDNLLDRVGGELVLIAAIGRAGSP